MGYRVHRNNAKFAVVEVSDGEVRNIVTDLNEERAKRIARDLNFGGGFDGKTPDFFLNKFSVSV